MNDDLEIAWQDYLKTRPQNVQEFAAKHPEIRPGEGVDVHGTVMYFIGFGEYKDGRVGVLVTPIDPGFDYEAAVAARQQICPDHFE